MVIIALPKADVLVEHLFGLNNLIRGACESMSDIAEQFMDSTNASCVVLKRHYGDLPLAFAVTRNQTSNSTNFQLGNSTCWESAEDTGSKIGQWIFNRVTEEDLIKSVGKVKVAPQNKLGSRKATWSFVIAAGTKMHLVANNTLLPPDESEKVNDDFVSKATNGFEGGVKQGLLFAGDLLGL